MDSQSPPSYPLDIQANSDIEKLVPISDTTTTNIVPIKAFPPESLSTSVITEDDRIVAINTESMIDHYLPLELSSNTLDEDHGVIWILFLSKVGC